MNELAAIEAACWRELQRAAQERDHAWRTLALATVARDGGADARSVILREVDTAQRALVLYTDARSPKVAQLCAQPRGTLLAWSSALRWQLRLRVTLSIETEGPTVATRWERLKHTAAAQDYFAPRAPGDPLDAPAGTQGEHFAVVRAQVEAMDWLELRAEGHRRATFGSAGARWVQP